MERHVGLTPIPTDANVEEFLEELWLEHYEELATILSELQQTIAQTEDAGEPAIFAYGKLLNYLASSEVMKPTLIRLLAASLWESL